MSANRECLIWDGPITSSGYGNHRVQGKQIGAHRHAWEQANGPIPDGMHIDHMCRNRTCVEVTHLRLATRHENAQNLSAARANNTSGYRGVYWHAAKGSWAARVKVAGKQYWKYGFATPEEAALVAQRMRDERLGNYAGEKVTVSEESIRRYRKKHA